MVNNSVEAEVQNEVGQLEQPPPPEEDIVTPHTVLASSNKGVDYDKLVGKEEFSCGLFLELSSCVGDFEKFITKERLMCLAFDGELPYMCIKKLHDNRQDNEKSVKGTALDS